MEVKAEQTAEALYIYISKIEVKSVKLGRFEYHLNLQFQSFNIIKRYIQERV